MAGFNLDRLQGVSLLISEVACDCQTWKCPRNHRVGGLVSFRGHYLPGSAGKDDALWIKWRIDEFYELARLDGLVVDCRDLDYTWGDDLHLRPRSRRVSDDFPFRLVIRPEQQEAFTFTESRDRHRFDVSTALAEIDNLLRDMRA
jgi:hypothetical protein